ncbi:hypothetical protein BDQ17DRAFT_1428446 [Cyathus striatus]|nr:hypothetical protein BDQ17DRAFT_1428446 [Cyathus striatus]
MPLNAFSTGEEVQLLGSTMPTHSNAEYIGADYCIVAPKPKLLSFENAAVVPLVGFTAWEMADKLGGVGSVGIQLAKARGVKKNTIVCKSQDVSINYIKALGTTHTINHCEPLKPQIEALNLDKPIKYILVFTNIAKFVLDKAIDVVASWGHIGLAVQGPPGSYDGLGAGQKKGFSLQWGFMFTRMALKWEIEYQGKALLDMARLFDEGKLKSITTKMLELTVQGAGFMEAGETIGKVVLNVPDECIPVKNMFSFGRAHFIRFFLHLTVCF